VGRLSYSEMKAITERIRGLVEMQMQTGVSASARALCHNCGDAKPLAGIAYYDRYRLCNDCALHYEMARAQGDVRTIDDFILPE
jgi:uncharacterized protein (DUF983 family)